jgi:predicted nuclease of restriction endonuclease-like (RecB) superfamily
MEEYSNYQDFFLRLKGQIQTARVKVILSANRQMLELYWWIGNAILNQQNIEGWGSKVISKLSLDLKDAFPDLKGISERNLKYMRAFAVAYPEFVQAALAQIPKPEHENIENRFVQAKLAQITWYHHITLLDKIKDEKLRYFYIEKTIENGWSRDVMVNQIENGLHLRQGKLQHNFSNTLPAVKSDLARELFKDPYKFDFLQLTQEANERDLEDALINNIYKFLLEMGKGFAFMGRQVHLEKGGQDYYLDLLFYHTKLHSHVILELKIGDFKPEHAGKMNFYLSAFDDDYRTAEDGPTIGIILCKSKNKVTAEYALRDVNKPMGIAEYNLTAAIPADLKAELPSIEDLEIELEKELEIPKSAIDEKLEQLNKLVHGLGQQEIKEAQSIALTRTLFNETIFELKNRVSILLEPVLKMFNDVVMGYSINSRSSYLGSTDLEADLLSGNNVHELGLSISLNGFKKAGIKSFNINSELKFFLEKYKYQIGP